MNGTDAASEPISARLRQAREQAGLSQGQVAKMLGLHRPSVSEMEAGRRKVSAEELAKLAGIYGVRVSWLTSAQPDEDARREAKLEVAARELRKLKPEDLDRLLNLLSTLRTEENPN